ncbi:MAG: malic enzyme-like NAD(P)-binding protein [Acidobacteriota bacterium]
MDVIGSKISKQQIVMLGAGSAATGISDQVFSAMVSEGLALQEASRRASQPLPSKRIAAGLARWGLKAGGARSQYWKRH